jgi:hypothetical protein
MPREEVLLARKFNLSEAFSLLTILCACVGW